MKIEVGPDDLSCFQEHLSASFGFQFDESHREVLLKTLRARMENVGSSRMSDYLPVLRSSAEQRALARALTVTETFFFRCEGHFEALSEIALPGRMAARGQGPLRILSAGCASGEEAYTIAMLIDARYPREVAERVEIRAIDVNTAALEKAKEGMYSEWAMRAMPEEYRSRYFHRSGGKFVLSERVRNKVQFEEGNLLNSMRILDPSERYDVIFCRNVLIYFSEPVIRSVISHLTEALLPGGFLFLGPAESLRGISCDFQVQNSHETFYYQRSPAENLPAVPSLVRRGSDTWWTAIESSSRRVTQLMERPGQSLLSELRGDSPLKGRLMELLAEERHREARTLLELHIAAVDSDPVLRLVKAVVLSSLGERLASQLECECILERDAANVEVAFLQALHLEASGDLDRAHSGYQSVVDRDPGFAMARLHLGYSFRSRANPKAASREFKAAVRILESETDLRLALFAGGFRREGLIRVCRAQIGALEELVV